MVAWSLWAKGSAPVPHYVIYSVSTWSPRPSTPRYSWYLSCSLSRKVTCEGIAINGYVLSLLWTSEAAFGFLVWEWVELITLHCYHVLLKNDGQLLPRYFLETFNYILLLSLKAFIFLHFMSNLKIGPVFFWDVKIPLTCSIITRLIVSPFR